MHEMPGLGCSWRLCRIYKYMTSCISEVYIVLEWAVASTCTGYVSIMV